MTTLPIIVPTLDADLPERIVAQLGEPGIDCDVHVVHDQIRQGFTRTVNEGLRWALDTGAQIVGIMSDDCRPTTDGWLVALVEALESDAHNGFAAPLMPCRTPGIMDQAPVSRRKIVEHWGLSYGCVLIKREVLRDVGLLDPVFDHYCSDTDHQFRARLFGWRSVVCWHVFVDRDVHPPRQPLWNQDQAKLKKRWG
jgi:GT2 family glycosyltransferase